MSNNGGGYENILSYSRDSNPWHGLWLHGTNPIFNSLTGSSVSTGQWHYIVAVQSGGTGEQLYVDGQLAAQSNTVQNANGNGTCEIGNNSVSETFPGLIDELRISSVARSADWIGTEYNNQSSPSSFYSLGGEYSFGGAIPAIGSITPNPVAAQGTLTINGSGFGTSQGSSTVTLNGTTLTPSSWSDTNIVLTLPSGATSGPMAVTTNAGSSVVAELTVGERRHQSPPSLRILDRRVRP